MLGNKEMVSQVLYFPYAQVQMYKYKNSCTVPSVSFKWRKGHQADNAYKWS